MSKYNSEKIFQEFWKDIICNDDGSINVERVKLELCDFYRMLQEVPKVYSEVTGGMLSKPLWDAETVLDYFREKYANKAWYAQLLQDDWNMVTYGCLTNEDYRKAIFKYLELE